MRQVLYSVSFNICNDSMRAMLLFHTSRKWGLENLEKVKENQRLKLGNDARGFESRKAGSRAPTFNPVPQSSHLQKWTDFQIIQESPSLGGCSQLEHFEVSLAVL